MFRTVVSVIIMVASSIAGMFLGALLNNAIGGDDPACTDFRHRLYHPLFGQPKHLIFDTDAVTLFA